MSNKRILLFVMAIVFLIISLSAVSAVDNSGSDLISSSDVSQTSLDNFPDTQKVIKEETNVKTSSESNNLEVTDVTTNDKTIKDDKNIKSAPKTIVITNSTLNNYFNFEEDNMGLKDSVSAGDVLDFQGNITRNATQIVINKPVNITASKGNSFICLNTTAQSMFGDEDLSCFMFTKGASYSNVTGIYLYNTQLYVRNANHITFNNITTRVYGQKVGSGVGQTSIRDNSSYIVVENSTFTTENNGGSSTFVLAWASHCTIRNNVMTGIGNVGNLIYLTTYNVEGVNENETSSDTLNSFNLIENNTVYGPATPQSICWGIVVCGKNNSVLNNKIYYNGTGITEQYMEGGRHQSINTTIKNNELYGCGLRCPDGGDVANNTVHGSLTPSATANIYNNTVDSVQFTSNTVLSNNIINGNVTITQDTQNITLSNCTVNGEVTIRAGDSSSSIPKNITLENLQINGAINLTSKNGAVDGFTVKNNNITDGIYLSSKRNGQIKNVLIENNNITSDDEYAVYVNKTVENVTIKNNRISSTDKDGDNAVYVKEPSDNDVTLTNNKAVQKQTQIVLNSVASTIYVNQSVTISGTFKVNGTPSKANSIDVYDNNSKIATVGPTGDNGVFNYTYKTATAGKHNVTFKFAENDTLLASQATKTITATNLVITSITLNANPTNVYVTQTVTFNATFNANGTAVKVNAMDVYDNGAKIASVGPTGTDGKLSYTYTAANAGSHNITFKFAGNVSHAASQASKTITVNNPIATSITLTGNSSMYYNDNLVITGTFKANGTGVKANSIDVYDNGTKVATVGPTGTTGTFNYTYKATSVGTHNITFKFAGNVSHKASQASKVITVNPIVTSITLNANPTSVYVTQTVTFNVTFKAANSAAKVNTLDVYDNGTKVATVGPTGTDGKLSYTYTAAKAGSHNITFKFAGNATHAASNATKTITVNNPLTTSITLTSNRTSLYLTEKANITGVFKEGSKAIKVNSITITDNGKQVATVGPTGTDGVFNYIFDGTTAGNHNLTFKFAGNVSHKASQASIVINVEEPKATSITLTANASQLYVDQSAKVDALFTFAGQTAGTYINNLTITDNGKKLATVGPSNNGKLTYEYVASQTGSHNLTFKFAGNVSHVASEESVIIIVKEPDATQIALTADKESLYVDQTAKVDALFSYVGESAGTYIESVTITDNDEQIATVGPANDGKLSYEYLATEIGEHVLTFAFAGNNTHASAESTITINVKAPDATEISLNTDDEAIYMDETSVVDVLFSYDGEVEGIYVDSIAVSDNGVEVAVIGPANDGVLSYEFLASEIGEHVLSFAFAGNNTHAACESNITITVKEPDATEIILTVDGETEFNVTESSQINGVFKYAGEDDGTYVDLITIYEDDVQIATVGPSDDGTFTYTYTPQKPGDHLVAFKFAGNNTHASAESSIEYHIRGYVLKVDTTDFIKGQNATIQASIYFENQVSTDINKGKVTFKVNGKTLKDENGKIIYAKIVNGTAKIENYLIPEEWANKNISIQAVSTASSQAPMLKSELEDLNVHEEEDPTVEEPQLTVEDVTATVGSPVTLKATLTDNDNVVNEGKVVFKVNGKSLKDENGKVIYAKIVNNEAVLEYTFPESWKLKEYTITAVLLSSDYPRLEANSTLTLSN
ncbi:MAG: Ig-like domain repeat protein [Methanosphaera sp.]|nr:Ig-like domain repeat protein [Methanosphaera sp.]